MTRTYSVQIFVSQKRLDPNSGQIHCNRFANTGAYKYPDTLIVPDLTPKFAKVLNM